MDRVLRPMSFLVLMDEMLHIYKSRFLTVVGIWAIVSIPLQLLLMHLMAMAGRHWFLMMYPLGLLVFTIAWTAITHVTSQHCLGRRSGILESLAATLRRPWLLFTTVLVSGLIALLGLFLFVLPSVVLAYLYVFVPAVFVVEGLSGSSARRRSMSLVSGQWWRIVRSALAAHVVSVAMAMAPFWIVSRMASGHASLSVTRAATTLIGCAIMPLMPIVVTLLYYDIRIRKEGLDVDLLARDVEASVETDDTKELPITA